MRPTSRRLAPAALLAVALACGFAACWRRPADPPAAADPARLTEFLRAHREGLGAMEQFVYARAVEHFRRAVELAPELDAAKINLALALLNDSGAKIEEARAKGELDEPSPSNFDEALALLDDVLSRDPANLHALYSRGVILQYLGENEQAHADFKRVVEADPADAHAWFNYGATLPDPDRPGLTANLKQAEQLIEIYEKGRAANPYHVGGLHKLFGAYNWAAATRTDPEAKREAVERRDELGRIKERLHIRNEGPGDQTDLVYGQMGKYSTVIDPYPAATAHADPPVPPRFAAAEPIRVDLPPGRRWAQRADFGDAGALGLVGRYRDRFGAAAAHFDADGDGRIDLYLAAAVTGPEGVRDVLLLNRGDGRFEDATDARGLPADAASLGVAAGDFDADGHVDLLLTGPEGVRLLRNDGGQGFVDITAEALGDAAPKAICPTARWLDLDQDGDLDLVVACYADAEHIERAFVAGGDPPPGRPNVAFRNDGRPPAIKNVVPRNHAPAAVVTSERETTEGLTIRLTPWEGEAVAAILGGDDRHTGLAALDLDDDRDIDLVLTADGAPPRAALNDRLGRFTAMTLDDLNPDAGPINGAVAVNLGRRERTDLVLVSPTGRLGAWRNEPIDPKAGRIGFSLQHAATDARAWRLAIAADVDLDGWTDLIGLPAPAAGEPPAPLWARNEGSRLATAPLPLGPDSDAPLVGLAYADLVGDPLPDLLLIRDGEAPRIARNPGNGHHWLALELAGRWKIDPGFMRTNPHGIGTKLLVEGPGLGLSYAHTTPESGPSQSIGPVVLGLGTTPAASLVRLRWPDGVMQAELNVPADGRIELAEYNRKTGSCPVLFTFDGERYACIGDFLGGGGLGYLVAPGEYGQPDRDESVHIRPDQLRPVGGRLLLSITEPMDEIAYLDKLTLEVVDRPPGVEAHPDERFAPGGNRPTGDLIAWREEIEPAAATDLEGRDVADRLNAFDRLTVDTFRRLRGWIGYAEPHGIVLDFGDRLAGFGPSERLVLCLAGWVEYPYSQTNYAAASAGVALEPPVLERLNDAGAWEVIEADPGYPAGMPRMTTLDLTGKLGGPRCVLRLRTNMECYWDRVFVARAEAPAEAGVRTVELPVAAARLGYRGYTREYSPDGRLPMLYDYEHVDPAPLARLAGELTRYGDVRALLTEDDDRFCLVGPGDEVRLEFDAEALPPLPDGWTRAYVLKAIGYCKDADPFTGTSDTVGPLPWKGMPDYPFGPEGERPRDPAYEEYLRTYQTRSVAP